MKFAGFMKIVGLVVAGFVSSATVMVGGIFLTGGFDPAYIEPTGLYFDEQQITIDGDTEVIAWPQPEDTTELEIDLMVSQGAEYIEVPATATMGEVFTITVKRNAQDQIIGGEAIVRASFGITTRELNVFVDVPVESFDIGIETEEEEPEIYVGYNFTVVPTNVVPANALNSTSSINSVFNKANKVIKYSSNEPSIATVDELTGVVTPISDGDFTIEARVISTYNEEETQPDSDDFEYYEDYLEAIEDISILSTRTFHIQDIEVEGISAVTNMLEPEYDIYLHKSITFTPEDLGLQLLPQADSDFTPEQLDYKLKDITVESSNPDAFYVTCNEDPLSWTITVTNYEDWMLANTAVTFIYQEEEEDEPISETVYFKLKQNNIDELYIEGNTDDTIQLTIREVNTETYDLLANTEIIGEDATQEATYTTAMYQVDTNQIYNELNELIIDADVETGVIESNTITPLNRGTTRVMAVIIKTDIDGNPIVKALDENGDDIDGLYDYYVDSEGDVRSIATDGITVVSGYSYGIIAVSQYITVTIMEELTSLDLIVKSKKVEMFDLGDTATLSMSDDYDETLVQAYRDGDLIFESTNDEVVLIENENIVDDDITVDIVCNSVGQIYINAVLIDLEGNRSVIDSVEINVTLVTITFEQVLSVEDMAYYNAGNLNFEITGGNSVVDSHEVSGVNKVLLTVSASSIEQFSLDYRLTDSETSDITTESSELIEPLTYIQISDNDLEFELTEESKTTFIMSREGVVLLSPNSYGALLDAYLYGKVEFIVAHSESRQASIDAGNNEQKLLEIYTSLDSENNLIVEILAINYAVDGNGDYDAASSYANIRARLVDGPDDVYLFNQRIQIETGIVENIDLTANTTVMSARISDSNEIQWLVPEGEVNENDELELTVNFLPSDFEPIVTGIYYTSSNTDVLEIVNNDGAEPDFIFKGPGTVTITATSLDPNATAQDSVVITVSVPQVDIALLYLDDGDENYTDADFNGYDDESGEIIYEHILAEASTIDLLLPELVGEPRIKATNAESEDITNILQYEIVEGAEFITFNESTRIVNEGENDEETFRTWEVTTLPVGSIEIIKIRVYTGLGIDDYFYYIKVLPDVIETVTYFGDSNPEIIYADYSRNLYPIDMEDANDRVVLTNNDLDVIENLTYSIHSCLTVDNGEDIGSSYTTINSVTGVLRVVDIPEALNIVIKVSTEFGYNAFYYVQALPNIDINFTYNNPVNIVGQNYEQIAGDTTFDLIGTGSVSATTIDPDNVTEDITSTLEFFLSDGDLNNEYITIDRYTGVITTITPPVDQYIIIKVRNAAGYTEYYNIVILA